MHSRLKGKSAVITGAGSGIGEATAKMFARHGASVAVLDIDVGKAEAVSAAIHEAGGVSIALGADVSLESDIEHAIGSTCDQFGRLDILVNNAAIQLMGPLHEFTVEQFDQLIAVNLKGVFLGSKHALQIMMAQKNGVILSTSSVLGVTGDPDLGIYGATKGAVIALTKSMAVGYGPYGIRANCVCPGDVATPMVKGYFNNQPDPEEARDAVSRHYPLRRIAEPDEVASVLCFLASDGASFVNGSHLFVDGGLMAEVY